MTDNGKPRPAERLESRSRIDGDALERRSAAFAAAVCRKGMPMSYGVGKEDERSTTGRE